MANSRKIDRKRARQAAVRAGIGIAAALAATTATVAAVTEYYIKKLVGIDYIDEEKDVYEDEN